MILSISMLVIAVVGSYKLRPKLGGQVVDAMIVGYCYAWLWESLEGHGFNWGSLLWFVSFIVTLSWVLYPRKATANG